MDVRVEGLCAGLRGVKSVKSWRYEKGIFCVR